MSADRDCADTGESALSTDCLDSEAASYPEAAEVLALLGAAILRRRRRSPDRWIARSRIEVIQVRIDDPWR